MDQVAQSGRPVVVTKHGKPVVQIIPAQSNEDEIFGFLAGKGALLVTSRTRYPFRIGTCPNDSSRHSCRHLACFLNRTNCQNARRRPSAPLASKADLQFQELPFWSWPGLPKKGRVETTLSVESFVRLCASKTTVLPITPEIAARAVSFPESYPKDPQDRLIGATALVEGIQLVTHDKKIKKSGMIPVMW
jgi:antitoxin (DNA-binding transcriptional repressor) of toxin-antitoxin stability system/predicted nucleic acid-binding protein